MLKVFQCIILTMLLPACAMQYTYSGKTFSNPADAIRSARTEIANKAAAVRPVSNPVGGRVKLVLPNRQRLRDVGIVTTGNVQSEQINYILEILQMGVRANADFLRNSRIFDSISVSEAYDTRGPSIENYDFLLWLYWANKEDARWYIRSSGHQNPERIIFNQTTKDMHLWIQSFTQSVHNVALEVADDVSIVSRSKPDQSAIVKSTTTSETDKKFPTKPIYLNFKKAKPRRDDIAIIIANADYKKLGKDIPNVTPAYADAEGIRQYAIDGLGIREDNVILLKDATSAKMERVFGNERSYKGQLYRMLEPGESRVFVYYSGHGAPGGSVGEGYLVPSDSDASSIDLNGYPLATLYKNLGELPTKSTTVVLEACFSGLSESGTVISNASPVFLKARDTHIPPKITVIAAGAANQIASWEKDKSHSLFTKFFLKGMSGEADVKPYGNGDKSVSWNELKHYLKKTVTRLARRYYGRDQTAQIMIGNER